MADPWGGHPTGLPTRQRVLGPRLHPHLPSFLPPPPRGRGTDTQDAWQVDIPQDSSITFCPGSSGTAERTGEGQLLTPQSRPVGRWASKAPEVVYKTLKLGRFCWNPKRSSSWVLLRNRRLGLGLSRHRHWVGNDIVLKWRL